MKYYCEIFFEIREKMSVKGEKSADRVGENDLAP